MHYKELCMAIKPVWWVVWAVFYTIAEDVMGGIAVCCTHVLELFYVLETYSKQDVLYGDK